MDSRLHQVWAADKGALNGWLSIPSTVTAEIAALQDYDSLTVDLQHGLVDYQAALNLMQTVHGHGKTVLARVPWNEPGIIMKMLDGGALGIICPMINTPEEAERFVGACQYAPRGYRSSGPTRAGPIYPDYFKRANDTIVTLAMIETVQAVENLDDILKTPNLTGVYVGPGDLAVSMGKPPALDHTDPEMVAVIDGVLAKVKAAGLKCGMHCLNPPFMVEAVKQGFDFVSLSSDVRLMTASQTESVGAFRNAGGGSR